MNWEDAPRPDRPRRRLAVIAVVAAAILGGTALLVAADDGAGQLRVRPTGSPRDPVQDPAATPSALPATALEPLAVASRRPGDGPLLPDGEAYTIVASQREQLTFIDTATGAARDVDLPPASRPAAGVEAMFASGDDVIVDHHGTVLRIRRDGSPVRIANRGHALPTTDAAGSVWLSDALSSAVTSTVMRVAPDGAVLERVTLPAIARPVAGTADGLVVWAPGNISVVRGGGVREVTGSGQLIATDGRRVAWVDCAASVECVVVLGTTDDPAQVRRPLDPDDIPGGYYGLPTGTYSPDGRWLAFPIYRIGGRGVLERPWVTVVDTATGAQVWQTRGPFTRTFSSLPLAWSPDSAWLFVASRDGVTAWRSGAETATMLPLEGAPPRALAVLASPS